MSSPAPPAAAEAAKVDEKKTESKPTEPEKKPAEPKKDEKKTTNDESKKENAEPNKKSSKPPSTVTSPTTGKDSPVPEANGEGAKINLREVFRAFSKFGDTKSDGKQVTLSQSDKWMKQARVIDGKTITTTDTAIHFKKFKQMKLNYQEYDKYLESLAKAKKIEVAKIKTKMLDCGPPAAKGTTSVVRNQAVDRLTDTSKYTGSHKLRFDETGKGRGAEGRRDPVNTTGYVKGKKRE